MFFQVRSLELPPEVTIKSKALWVFFRRIYYAAVSFVCKAIRSSSSIDRVKRRPQRRVKYAIKAAEHRKLKVSILNIEYCYV